MHDECMDKLNDGITTDQQRVRDDDINIGGTIVAILTLNANMNSNRDVASD